MNPSFCSIDEPVFLQYQRMHDDAADACLQKGEPVPMSRRRGVGRICNPPVGVEEFPVKDVPAGLPRHPQVPARQEAGHAVPREVVDPAPLAELHHHGVDPGVPCPALFPRLTTPVQAHHQRHACKDEAARAAEAEEDSSRAGTRGIMQGQHGGRRHNAAQR